MNCSYCAVNAASTVPYRRRAVSSVIREMERAVFTYNTGFINFEDENLSMNREWFHTLLKTIKERFKGYKIELRAMNGLFPQTLDDETIREMKQAGFKTLNLSLGTTVSEQFKRFQRVDVRKAFDGAVKLAEAHDLDAVGYVIAGAPFQNASGSVADLLYLAQRRVLAGVSIFYPAPGSDDYRLCERLHILPGSYHQMRASTFPLSHTTSRTDAATLMRLGRILNFIKALLDAGLKLPDPMPAETTKIDIRSDRTEIGIRLLQPFLYDGSIRGVTPGGDVYAHRVSLNLTRQFIGGLKEIRIRGYKSMLKA